jgi:hypothetical protein
MKYDQQSSGRRTSGIAEHVEDRGHDIEPECSCVWVHPLKESAAATEIVFLWAMTRCAAFPILSNGVQLAVDGGVMGAIVWAPQVVVQQRGGGAAQRRRGVIRLVVGE